MKIDVLSLDGSASGSIELSDEIFGLEPRADLIARMIRYQLAARRAGTHAVKNRAEIARTGKKMYKQKGTGGARHGSARVPQFRGGGRAFGPQVRSHAHDLPKKVRALALKPCAVGEGQGRFADHLAERRYRRAEDQGAAHVVRQDRPEQCADHRRRRAAGELQLAARNIPNVDVLPIQGINVYDIVRRDKLVLTRAAIEALEARFK